MSVAASTAGSLAAASVGPSPAHPRRWYHTSAAAWRTAAAPDAGGVSPTPPPSPPTPHGAMPAVKTSMTAAGAATDGTTVGPRWEGDEAPPVRGAPCRVAA